MNLLALFHRFLGWTGPARNLSARLFLLALPLALIHSRAIGEFLIAGIALWFLFESMYVRDWSWLRRPWVALPLAWCGWTVLCTLLAADSARSMIEAPTILRFVLLAAALEHWLLRGAEMRRWLAWSVTFVAAWTALQCWQQYLFGFNMFGEPRYIDGSLTGPFGRPLAGPTFFYLLWPALLPPVMALLQLPGWRPRLAGGALAVAGLLTMLLIGQRMPSVLALLALVVCGLLLPRLRMAVLAATAAGALLLVATPIISPPTHAKLVVHFAEQMEHFGQSPYGQIYRRAIVMISHRPLTGFGFNGFHDHCADPAYVGAQPLLGITAADNSGADACTLHAHNYYLDAGAMGGLPGLLLFAAFAVAWLARAAGRLGQPPDARRVALFATLLAGLWPIASTSGVAIMPIAGWLFLTAGWATALRRPAD